MDVAKQLHKTKICKHFLKNKCRFGNDCSYAHCVTEQRDRPDLRKTKLCRLFEQGRCRNPDCTFAHGPQELRGTVGVWKTVMCSKFASGTCRAGATCRFAHGDNELQPAQAAVRGPGVSLDRLAPQQGRMQQLPGPLPAAPFAYGSQFTQMNQYPLQGGYAYAGFQYPQGLPGGASQMKEDPVETVAQLVSLMSEHMGEDAGATAPAGAEEFVPVNEERRHVWPPTPDFVPTPMRPPGRISPLSAPLPGMAPSAALRSLSPISPEDPEAINLIPPSLFSPEGEHRGAREK